MARLRLVKVICQAVFVLDDGEALVEQLAEPVAVSAAEWPSYATTTFREAFEALKNQVENELPPEGTKP